MQPLIAIVKNGRLTLDEPTDRAEGEAVVLLPLEELLAEAETYGAGDGTVAFSVTPARQFKKPKPVDAAALIEELRSI